MRIITYVISSHEIIFLLNIYDKSELSTLKTETIKQYVRQIQKEFQSVS